MDTTRLSTKGQIVLPVEIRNSQGWGPGTEITIEVTAEGVLLRPAQRFPPSALEEVAGCLRPPRRARRIPVHTDEAVRREVERRHDGGRY